MAIRSARISVVFHDLRHSFGTLAVQVWPITDVQFFMGHAEEPMNGITATLDAPHRHAIGDTCHHRPDADGLTPFGAAGTIAGRFRICERGSPVPSRLAAQASSFRSREGAPDGPPRAARGGC